MDAHPNLVDRPSWFYSPSPVHASVAVAPSLQNAGLVRRVGGGVRLLAKGALSAKIEIEVTGASKAAVEAVEKAGGSVTVL